MAVEIPGYEKALSQPSTYGKPRRIRNQRYYQLADKVLTLVLFVGRWMLLISLGLSIALATYAAFGVKHTNAYSSDGTLFSCFLETIQNGK